MIGDDHQLLAIPHLGMLAKFLLEDGKGGGSTHIMGEQDIHIHPNIFSGLDLAALCMPRQYFFSKR